MRQWRGRVYLAVCSTLITKTFAKETPWNPPVLLALERYNLWAEPALAVVSEIVCDNVNQHNLFFEGVTQHASLKMAVFYLFA